ncbi:MAG TPA: 23S rRNA (pseudouridine(1915)-N(3))-methyltransferase RlmH [Clostridiales bacterium]|nr:23S rRNA (pseudouridine(1915)-N(3))-methyltransferase RlmH [Clostridiales bacterium]
MRIEILCVGKMKDGYFKAAQKEYLKRLSAFGKVDVVEIPDAPIPDHASEKECIEILRKEGEKLLAGMKKDTYFILLDVKGKDMDSVEFSETIKSLMVSGQSHLTFAIGGSLGVSQEVRNKAHLRLSLSSMTFTHNMTRVILLEQVYRAFSIINNRTYHK